MTLLQGTRTKFERKVDAVLKCDTRLFSHCLRQFFMLVREEESLRAIDLTLEGKQGPDAWLKEYWKRKDWSDVPAIPDNEVEMAALFRGILRRISIGELNALRLGRHLLAEDKSDTGVIQKVREWFFEPLANYYADHLVGGGQLLYLLEKFKIRCEAFDRTELYIAYRAAKGRGEAILDRYVRRFLLDQGIDYPFSSPLSASGRPDIVAIAATDKPCALEVKTFKLPQYARSYLAKGFAQAYRYACDYAQPFGYLVVFNVSQKELIFQTSGHAETLPCVTVGDKAIFIVVIRLFPDVSASAKGKLQPYIVTERELTQTGRSRTN